MHEGYVLDGTPCALKSEIWKIPFRDLSQSIGKMRPYSTLGARKLQEKGVRGGMAKALHRGSWAYLRNFVFHLGILDGWPGFVIAFANFERHSTSMSSLRRCRARGTRSSLVPRGWRSAARPVHGVLEEFRRPGTPSPPGGGRIECLAALAPEEVFGELRHSLEQASR